MRIMLVHNQYQHPGGEDVVFEQERRLLQRAGHQVVLYQRSNLEIDENVAAKRIKLVKNIIWATDTLREFTDLLAQEKPQLVHVHNTFVMVSPSIYLACEQANIPVMQTLHNYRLICPAASLFRDGHVCEECIEHSLWRGVRYGCYRDSRLATGTVALMLEVHRKRHTWDQKVQGYIALTEFARSKFVEGGLPPEKIFVKPNFVYPDPGAHLSTGEYAIFVGRLSREKGLNTLLAAWGRLGNRIPLMILGEGPESERLKLQAAELGLTLVSFLGQVPRAEALARLRGACCLIVPSECYETFALTIAEAFACSTPVICSRLGAMQEIVEDGRTGLHFTAGDADDLAAKVEWAWTHSDQIKAMGREARLQYEMKYTAERNYEILADLYQRILGSSPLFPLRARERKLRIHQEERLRVISVYNRYLNRGGEEEVFELEGKLLNKHGHDVTFVTEDVHNPHGLIESTRLASDVIWSRSWYARFEALLKEKKPQLVHVHNAFPTISPSIYYACRDAGVPVVQSLHNPRLLCPAATFYRDGHACEDCLGKLLPWPSVLHGCYQNSRIRTSVAATMLTAHRYLGTWRELIDIFIVFTEFYRRKFIQGGLPGHKIMVKPHFVDPDPGLKSNQGNYALFIGRLSPEKGVRTLLGAWKRLRDIPLKIRGNGPLLEEVRDFAAQCKSCIEVLPNRLLPREWADLMTGARFLVWPSEGYYETFGLVAIEAFAFGMPVIASRIGAMAEIVANHQTGLHFTAGDSEDLARKVAWAWTHPNEMQVMGRNARCEYEAKYTAEQNYEMLVDIYQRAMLNRADNLNN
jgi:glycosyltransferase involved in cell wall biosynthesis